MTGLGIKTAGALVLAGMLCAASPAFADHDHDRHWHGHGHSYHHEHHGDWNGGRTYYYGGGYAHHYYYSEPDYYYGPRAYVPVPAPPSFGLNLVFPIH